MKFGIEKCSVAMKRERKIHSVEIRLPEGKLISAVDQTEGYKYLGALEEDTIFREKMRKVNKDYFRRVRKVEALNTSAVSVCGTLHRL